MLANRISYSLGLTGPSFLLDTACSSSMYAMDCAFSAIRNGECDSAIVGGSNLILHPYVSLQFARYSQSNYYENQRKNYLSIVNCILLDWVFSHQMVSVDHSILMPLDIHVRKPCVRFSCKKPKMQREFIQLFCTRKQIVTVSFERFILQLFASNVKIDLKFNIE